MTLFYEELEQTLPQVIGSAEGTGNTAPESFRMAGEGEISSGNT